ncbi:hypothetical protein G9A89_009742 [Geosiphon pyriformis]|nr:hypothetical protein G9A89_009742 [Geosiphon pyriformis]
MPVEELTFTANNKDKQKVKQYSKTIPNTPKTTAKHLQTLNKEPQKPILTSTNIIDYLQENESNHSENLKSEETESEQEETIKNEEEMATAYIAKISEFTEWLDKVQKAKDINGWNAARMLKAIPYFLQGTAEEWFENLENPFKNWQAFKDVFLQQFTNNNTSITLHNYFHNIKQETSETILDQFIARLKDKLIKKVCPHVPTDLAIAIKHAKNYKMTMKEANHTKLTNSQKRLKTTLQTNNNNSSNHKDINYHKDAVIDKLGNNAIKTILDHHPTTNLKIVIIVESQNIENKITENCKETNKTGQSLPIQQYQTPPTQQYQVPARRLVQHNQFTFQSQFQNNNNRINPNNHYLTMAEESDFQQPALSEDKVAAPRSNPSNNTIPLTQIAQNANLSNIFPFEFKANELPFLLSNTAANEQKAITAMYTEAIAKGKPIWLILDSRLAGSIITYQLIQQLQKTVDRLAQTVIVIANGMKKTPVGEIDNFLFTIDGIIILVKVLVIDAPQYQVLVKNNWLLKANANLDWETQELKISYQEQHTRVPATCSTFNKKTEKASVFEFKEEKELPVIKTFMALGSLPNWAEETEQKIFEETRG